MCRISEVPADRGAAGPWIACWTIPAHSMTAFGAGPAMARTGLASTTAENLKGRNVKTSLL